MKFTSKDDEDITVVTLNEKHLDLATSLGFKKIWEGLFERKREKIILDLSEVEFMDSHSMGIIMTTVVHLRKQGGDIKIASPNDHLKRVFSLVRMDELFEIYSDCAKAVKAFQDHSTDFKQKGF